MSAKPIHDPLATAFSAWIAPDLIRFFAGWAVILTLLGFVWRAASLIRSNGLKPKSTLQTAIGSKHPRIAQKAQGFMGGSLNTREFFHGATPQAMRRTKYAFLLPAFVVPVALLALARSEATVLAVAFVLHYLGLLAERWYFLADANDLQNLYYQAMS